MQSDNQRPRVLICDPIAQEGIDMLSEHADVDIKKGPSQEELLEIIDNYEAVIVRSATKIRAPVIEQGSRLKVIGRAGAGLDNIDITAAHDRQIKVVNCPDANTLSVAEHTMALLLGLVRHLPQADASMKAGKWEKKQFMGLGLAGKTIGIIGFGRIGHQVAVRARAFGMKVLINQRRSTPELALEDVEPLDLVDLLKQADFVTLHVPARPETEKMIGRDQLALMKPTAYLINTARGSVIDEEALLEALNQGTLAGAALDVYANEPVQNHPLAQHPRVIATPHIAASTVEAQQSAAITVAKQILEVIQEKLENPLSLQIIPLDRVFPHENVDPGRVKRLITRLEADGILSNPPVVLDADDHYVVLDGASRTIAFKQLGYPHLVAQVISDKTKLKLHSWNHAVCQAEPARLVKLLDDLPEISMVESDPQKVLDEMLERGGLCHLQTINGKVFFIEPASGVNHLEALNKLTETYIEVSYVERTLATDLKLLQQEYPDLTALVIFPAYTIEQVLQIARAGRVLPAGITRFLIPGRVLRLNVDLKFLKSDQSLNEKNDWLNRLVMEKMNRSQIRYYQEPVYLLDE